ncbi:hypothetical protein [uncultured Shewanella sp.]|uniref:hypothetical protein n=1 Tax=uncultured Shewanella sp. TaxID=173975 RepID=UPI002620FC38|nr:hypothetical protein [uncultured Shewanella sp.]
MPLSINTNSFSFQDLDNLKDQFSGSQEIRAREPSLLDRIRGLSSEKGSTILYQKSGISDTQASTISNKFHERQHKYDKACQSMKKNVLSLIPKEHKDIRSKIDNLFQDINLRSSGGHYNVMNGDDIQYLHKLATDSKSRVENMPVNERLQLDIRNFNKSSLSSLPVYFANTNSQFKSGFLPYHGFIATGTPGSTSAEKSGRTYKLSRDIMLSSVNVSNDLISKAMKSNSFNDSTKTALEQLKGKTYATAEHFLKDLFKAINQQPNSTTINIDQELSNLSKEFKNLLSLNSKVNKDSGAYSAGRLQTTSSHRDFELFQQGKTSNSKINIKAITLQEVMQEQAMYQRYLEDQLGIGKAATADEKRQTLSNMTKERASDLANKLVKHKRFSTGEFQSNCNKSAASLAQTAINKEQGNSYRTPQHIETATVLSIGSKDRMHFHDPLSQ